MLFLQSHGVNTSHATKIFRTYGEQSIEVVRENPYRLADDIWGIGFMTADTIATKLGVKKDAAVRLRSGLLYSLNRVSEEGHCYALRKQLFEAASQMLETTQERLHPVLDEMIRCEDVIVEDEAVYLPPFHVAENGVARRIRRLLSSPVETIRKQNAPSVPSEIGDVTPVPYDETQLTAINTGISTRFMVLTGGPGTGKTTTILGIIQAFLASGKHILCAAPTGRAARG